MSYGFHFITRMGRLMHLYTVRICVTVIFICRDTTDNRHWKYRHNIVCDNSVSLSAGAKNKSIWTMLLIIRLHIKDACCKERFYFRFVRKKSRNLFLMVWSAVSCSFMYTVIALLKAVELFMRMIQEVCNVSREKGFRTYSDCEAPDQPAHPHSLIWKLQFPMISHWDPITKISRHCSPQIRSHRCKDRSGSTLSAYARRHIFRDTSH